MPVAIWVGAFGALLGFTMLTRVSSALVWAGLIVGALLPGVLWLSLAYGVTFGVARTAVVMTRRTDTIDIVGRTAWKVNAIVGLALIFLGTLLGG